MATKTERLEQARAELDHLASTMKQLRRELKQLRDSGEPAPSALEASVADLERGYRNARARQRRQEAASAR